MKKSRLQIVSVLLTVGLLCYLALAEECTTGLARAACTANGRTLLWKNRDSSNRPNAVHFFRKGESAFLGLINAGDTTQVWAGVNHFGLAIMNAEALDMAVPGEATEYDDEGYLMKTVLERCRTVADFATYLDTTNMPGRKVTSNFGVIDALGNAAYFEVGNHEYFRFEAPPNRLGFAVRANFAFQARSTEGYGKVRYRRAVDLLTGAVANNQLTAEYILTRVAPDIQLPDSLLQSESRAPELLSTRQTINRFRTVACAVFESIPGVPALTTFWVVLGEPAVGLAVPVWVAAGGVPQLLDSAGYAPLNRQFTRLRELVYPDTTAPSYLDRKRLPSIQKQLRPTQKRIFRATARQIKRWQKKPPTPLELQRFQEQMAEQAYQAAGECLRRLQTANF